MKSLYVSILRVLRALAGKAGLLRFLERRSKKPAFLYLRSLFAIYDIEDMVRLDLPWWTFKATEQIALFLKMQGGDAEIFEYGPGASTVWLAKRARRVAFVEHDVRFRTTLDHLLMGVSNVSGEYIGPEGCEKGEITCASGRKGYDVVDFSKYVAAIRNANGPFDLIVIDGRARVACLEEAKNHLKPGGIILFDNSGRKRYRQSFKGTQLSESRFTGLAPALPYIEQTSILTQNQSKRL